MKLVLAFSMCASMAISMVGRAAEEPVCNRPPYTVEEFKWHKIMLGTCDPGRECCRFPLRRRKSWTEGVLYRLTFRGVGWFHLDVDKPVTVPILDDLFVMRATRESTVSLERVTGKVPQAYRPLDRTRVITSHTLHASLFHNERTLTGGTVAIIGFDNGDVADPVANLRVHPPAKQFDTRGKPEFPEPVELRVRSGESISLQAQSYRVQKVVPDLSFDRDWKQVERTSPNAKYHFSGWIEIDRKPTIVDVPAQ